MEKINFINNQAPALNATNLNQIQDNVENAINELKSTLFPIGSIIIKDNNTDYSNWLGFTWTKVFAGKVLVGLDTSDTDFNTIGKTGGSKDMQKHKHYVYQNLNGNKFAVVTEYDTTSGVTIAKLTNSSGTANASNTTYTQDTNKGIVTDDYAGTGNSGNLQPYQVVAYWKRTA